MTAPTPGPDAVARDEVGEVGPTLRTADDLRQYEREGVRLDGSMGFAWWVDGDWITATDQYFSSKALIEDYGFVFVSFDPHLTPQPDGDVREADEWLAITLAARIVKALSWDHPDAERDALHVARTVLASGLVVPAGRRDRAEAQVAAVRRELERWDGYGHGEFNIHMPENLPCSACNLMAAIRAEIRAALDTAPAAWKRPEPTSGVRTAEQHKVPPVNLNNAAPASPTTDQRIEARQLSGDHVGREVVLPDGTRGTLHALTRFSVQAVVRVDEFTHARRHLDPADVVTLIGGEE